MKNKKTVIKRFFYKSYRELTHEQKIEELLKQYPFPEKDAVIVEIGSGFTTMTIAKIAKLHNALFYSLDSNLKKIEDIKKRMQDELSNVVFIVGDSHENLPEIAEKHDHVHFVFFDSAPSAMHTFQEFIRIEKSLKPGSCILIDNAAIPGEKALLSPCRKGKILVPYLLSLPCWQVFGHPHAGDSMVSAVYKTEPEYAHPDYELSGWNDSWKYEDKR